MSDTTRSPDGPAAGGTGPNGPGSNGVGAAGGSDQNRSSPWSGAAVYGPIPTGPQAHAQPLDRSTLPGGATLPEPGEPLPPAPVPVWAPPAPQPRKKSLRELLRLERLGIEKKPEPAVSPTGLAAAAVAAQENEQAAEQAAARADGGALGAVSPYSREASGTDPYSSGGGYGGNGAYGSSGFGSPGYGAAGATAVGAAAAGAALAGSAGAGVGAAGSAGAGVAGAGAGVAGGGVAAPTGYPSTDGPSTAVIPAVPITAYSASGDALDAPQPLPRISAPRRTRKARLRLARLDPWSVMKTAFLFSIAAGIMFVVAVYVIWGVVSASELFASLNGMVQDVLSTPGDTTPFRIEDYVNTQKVMGVTALLAVVDVVIFTALATLGSFLYNLAATMLGGLEVTLAED